jgi:hypothetical protein
MSKLIQPNGRQMAPGPQPNPQQPTTEVVVDDSSALPTYANFCRVMATPEEVILDFGLNTQPFMTGGQFVTANQRIVMNLFTTKRLLAAIGTTIQRHEQTFGTIETDVNRRASASAPQRQFAPAREASPTNQPEVIKLF